MDKQTILQEMTPIFVDLFEEDDIQLTEETTADNIEDWDSLTHVHLIVLIEKHFDVKFTSIEIGAFDKVGDIVEAIVSKK